MVCVSNYYPPMPYAAFERAIEIANRAGRNGKCVSIQWIPPFTATQDPIGVFAVSERTPTIDD